MRGARPFTPPPPHRLPPQLNGQTALHFCFAYHFEELGQYLLSKGADDSILNADGLTCYEGLSRDDVDVM